MNSHTSHAIRFGPFECDILKRELRRKGRRVKIQDQPFEVLNMLLRSAGTMVSREQFRHALWPDDTFVDFENGLNRAICKLREALEDTPAAPKYIETVARHGYRFVGVVASTLRLAVLPLADLSGNRDSKLFADGISQELIGELTKLDPRQVRVIAFASVNDRGGRESAAQIGQALGLTYVLDGSVRRSDHRVRVMVQLIEIAGQAHVWSESYDSEISDPIAVQSEIACRVRCSLAEHLLLSPELSGRGRRAI